ncbi:terpenoid cyclases/protein prenyltransferase alpha-alpha toroid [Russula earlei]|uniref:Terpenoid cyclases/protein prenyltransferase alpha-alpha toroid n=1 Tax=Russula earlei TaxID=71964 RepID=A0ACC0U380_9AGAM|nr:terpenoid cyclases/protein prenyltransferase alpha-alpha toroid [Russula earlei]
MPRPTPIDAYPTETSDQQADTEDILQRHVPLDDRGSGGRVLNKRVHLEFLVRNLAQGFPARYVSQDASQPWLMFWTLQSFSALQIAIDPDGKQRAIDTIMQWQHPDGGFGGGPGQAAHLLPTYAAVCSLAIVGRPGPGGGWDQIDRDKLYQWYMSLKQRDGSFIVSTHGEVDVRGIYCLLAVALLLDIAFIASCQTYEGGFSSASHPCFTDDGVLAAQRPSLGEAHGGYTFCALASWVLLQPYISASEDAPRIDVRRLLRWLVHMQGSEVELGGFKGRTNKLVDGCYSWWVGGAFALLEALGMSPSVPASVPVHENETASDASPLAENGWDDADDSFFNRQALQEYILLAGQHPAGGLRDKPPKNPDAYHTAYCISGLSAAQHHVHPSPTRREEVREAWQGEEGVRATAFAEALCWVEEDGVSHVLGPAANRINATHSLFNLTITHTEGIMAHFYAQSVPKHVSKPPRE